MSFPVAFPLLFLRALPFDRSKTD